MNQSQTFNQHLAKSAIVKRQDISLTEITNNESFKEKWDNSQLSRSIASKYSIIQNHNNMQNSSILSNSRSFSRKPYDRNLQRQQVRSIIFDSKIQKNDSKKFAQTLMATYLSQNKINAFKDKVVALNVNIETGISNVQKMIQEFRRKKQQYSHQRQEQQISNRFEQSKYICQQILEESQQSGDSKVQLQGQSKAQFSYPPEYTAFINRLSHQIQIDMQFTNMVAEFTQKNLISQIKSIILNELLSSQNDQFIQSFLIMEPSEIDPLQPKPEAPVKHTHQWLKEKAQQLYNHYTEIQAHFSRKLKHKFSPSIVKLLFQQLSKSSGSGSNNNTEAITIGQLLSYVNIKTNTSFRNRFFVKIMKRLNLKGNGSLNTDSFNIFVNQ